MWIDVYISDGIPSGSHIHNRVIGYGARNMVDGVTHKKENERNQSTKARA